MVDYLRELPVRIGIDSSRLTTAHRTGTEQYTYELLAALARYDQQTAFTLYSSTLPALPPLGANFALCTIPFPRLWTHLRLSAELVAHPPDVLFVPAHVLPAATPLLRRTRAVVTIHDLGYLHVPEGHTRAQQLLLRITTAWSARVADAIIVPSHATRQDLVTHTRTDPARIHVIPHGTRFASTPPPPPAPVVRPYLLYVGTLQPRKNLVRLVEAFARIAPQHPDLDLWLVGRRGWLAAPIVARISALGLQDRVRLPGYVSDAELPAIYAAASAFVFPSLYEGFGMPVLEAMARGVPVLTSASSSLPEVAGDAALLVDPNDVGQIASAMQRLVTDPVVRQDLRMRGLARAARYSWDACAAATMAVVRGAGRGRHSDDAPA